jgi:NADH-quinone oxidoreductase subunit M
MLNHGVVTGALFLSVGIVYDRTHTRKIADYGGLASIMPLYAAFFMVFTLASIGLPATNGFIGEFLILLGGFTANKLAGVLASTGIIIGAWYMLWLYQRIFFMDINQKVIGLPDMDVRESLTLIPMLLLVFWIGVYPNSFLGFMHASVQHLLERVNTGGMQEAGVAKTIMEVVR